MRLRRAWHISVWRLFFVLSGFVIEYNYAEFVCRPGGFLPRPTGSSLPASLVFTHFISLVSCAPSLQIPHPNFTPLVTLAYLDSDAVLVQPGNGNLSAGLVDQRRMVLLLCIHSANDRTRRPSPSNGGADRLLRGGNRRSDCLYFICGVQPLTEFVHRWFWHRSDVSAEADGLWLVYFCPYLRLLEFISGVLAAKIYRMRKSSGPAPISARLVIFLGIGMVWRSDFCKPADRQPDFGNRTPKFHFRPGARSF